jgi:4-alpha-glucanotransferase
MNVPGKPAGNWRWRLTPGQLSPTLAEKLATLTGLYDR